MLIIWHPDKHHENKHHENERRRKLAEEKTKEIDEAYEITYKYALDTAEETKAFNYISEMLHKLDNLEVEPFIIQSRIILELAHRMGRDKLVCVANTAKSHLEEEARKTASKRKSKNYKKEQKNKPLTQKLTNLLGLPSQYGQ